MSVKDLYYKKYLKYKNKYLNLESQLGGNLERPEIIWVKPIYSNDNLQVKIVWIQPILTKTSINLPIQTETVEELPASIIPNLNAFYYEIVDKDGQKISHILYQSGQNVITAFLTGLNYNKPYNFVVKLMKNGKSSINSKLSEEIKILTKEPLQPQIQKVEIRNDQAKITWNFLPIYGGGGLSYVIYNIYVNNELKKSINGNNKEAIVDIYDLIKKNEPLHFSIIATNKKGNSIRSPIVFPERGYTPRKPLPPLKLSVQYGSDCALLTCKMNDFGNTGITKYIITFNPNNKSLVSKKFEVNFKEEDEIVVYKLNNDEMSVLLYTVVGPETKNINSFIFNDLSINEGYNCDIEIFNKFVKDSYKTNLNNSFLSLFSMNNITNKTETVEDFQKIVKKEIFDNDEQKKKEIQREESNKERDTAKDKIIIDNEIRQTIGIETQITTSFLEKCKTNKKKIPKNPKRIHQVPIKDTYKMEDYVKLKEENEQLKEEIEKLKGKSKQIINNDDVVEDLMYELEVDE